MLQTSLWIPLTPHMDDPQEIGKYGTLLTVYRYKRYTGGNSNFKSIKVFSLYPLHLK